MSLSRLLTLSLLLTFIHASNQFRHLTKKVRQDSIPAARSYAALFKGSALATAKFILPPLLFHAALYP